MPKLSTRHEAVVGSSFWKEEQRNEREALFDAEQKKVAASDRQLATTWWRRGELNSCPKTLQRELLRAQTLVPGRTPFPLLTGQTSNRPVG